MATQLFISAMYELLGLKISVTGRTKTCQVFANEVKVHLGS